MRNHLRIFFFSALSALFTISASYSQTVPELLYFKFDNPGGTTVPNLASTPVGTNPAPITGGLAIGGAGQFGAALQGNGASSSSNVINTGWNTNLSGDWTISFWVSNIASSSTLYYIFGDAGASTFRCFTNGVAGANNWMLRGGGLSDILVTNAATMNPNVVTFVYDATLSEVRAYVDGVLNNTVSQPAVSISGTGLQIGGYATNTNLAAGGLMDEFRIYNRALTQSEIDLTWNHSLPLSSASNDAGVASIDSPFVFCEGAHNIVATIQNFWIKQINSVTVNWTYNGIPQTPITHTTLLDTFGGANPNKAQIVLGNKTFISGQPEDIVAWTSMPNGVADTSINNDTADVTVMPSMSGAYTIDPFGSGTTNYPTFSDAVNDLNNFGICGPVTFNVAGGLYPEQVNIGNIVGASANNTITFQADPNNVSPVELSFSGSSSDNYVVRMNGCNYVTFDGIDILSSGSYCTAFLLEGGASNNQIMNCNMNGPLTTTTSTNAAMVTSNGAGNENNLISGNYIHGGSYGIYYRGSGTTSLVNKPMIENNVIENPYYQGIYLYYTNKARVHGNYVTSNSSYGTGYGIYTGYSDSGLVVTSNQVLSMGTNWPTYGIYVYYCDHADDQRGVVANNMVHVGEPGSTGVKYGLSVYYNNFSDVVFNTVVTEGTSTTSRPGYLYGGANNIARNNNLMNYGNGYVIYTLTGNFNWDYNNLATNGSTFAYHSGAIANFTSWQGLGHDANSINVNNIYANPDSLRTCDPVLYKKGIEVAAMKHDFDGDPRIEGTPNIGADEYIIDANDFSIGDTITFCGGDELVLGGTMNDGTFIWSTGATTPTITVTEEGNYTVTVDGPCATGMVDDVEVIDVNPVANFVIEKGQFIGGFQNTSEYGTSYHWDFGDGTTSTEENPWHEYEDNGPYTITLTVMNYCDTVTISKDVQFSVGLNEITFGSKVNVYPNPASNILNLAFGNIEDQTVQLELLDMKGQQISNQLVKVSQNSVESIDISSLTKGVYLIKLTTDKEVATKQVVVR